MIRIGRRIGLAPRSEWLNGSAEMAASSALFLKKGGNVLYHKNLSMSGSSRNRIRTIIARRAGFCFGVKRAIDLAFRASRNDTGVFTLGPIIHNPQVIAQLRSVGVEPTEDIDDGRIRKLIVRTHGVARELSESLSGRLYEVIDATCPFVKKAQQYAKLLHEEGYQVLIIGDREHPEVRGLVSYAGEGAVVLKEGDPLPRLRTRVGIIVQTTQPAGALQDITVRVVPHVRELKICNTICNSTGLRLKETRQMAQSADVMLVVGGKNSANTTQLASLCRSLGIPTYHIETAAELDEEWFRGVRTVGITAGASTPDWIIREVESRIRIQEEGHSYGKPG